jgi:type VI secretion system protein ImpA
VEAVALLLETEWENVHPKGEGGDFSYRGVMIESIDALPTVINPLQFLPLVENRRHGTISYRVIQIVSGEIAVGENEVVPDLTAIDRIIEEADLAPLKATSASFVQLATAIDRIGAIWSERSGSDQSLSVDRLSKTTAAIVAWLRQAIVQRDPDAVPAEAEADATSVDAEGRPEIAPAVGGKISSTAAAAAALVAIATYFAGTEPSNPALLLVRQAQQMIGKSFVEVIQILVPLHAETAVIHVGKQQTFDLPISPMAHLLDTGESFAPHPGDSQDIVFSVENRTQALALMEKVAAYFRQAEPSNPVPFLIDKAKEMAQRDFLALLRDVLPEGALKTLDT